MRSPGLARPPFLVSLLTLSLVTAWLSPSSLAKARTGKEPEPLPGRAKIMGKIVKSDGKSSPHAVVHAIHLESGKVFHSEPAAGDGGFSLPGLPYGYYELAIEADGTLHALSQPVNLAPAAKMNLDLVLSDAGAPQERAETGPSIPGLDRQATGRAEVRGLDRTPFLKTKVGIATLVGVSVLMLVLLG